MATTYEKQPDGQIIYKPADIINVPDTDLITLLFESETCQVPEDKPVHLDADDPTNHLTKGELRRQSMKLAHVFRDQFSIGASGPNKDVVCIISNGHFMMPLIFYGAVMAEGVLSSTSPSATPDEFAYQLRQTGGKVIVCTPDTKATALAAAKKAGVPPSRVLQYSGSKHIELTEAESGARVPISNQMLNWRRITDRRELQESIICLLFSSGTTGLPKAMRLSHRNMVAACSLAVEPMLAYQRANRPPGFQYTTLAHLPAAHIAGVQGYMANGLYSGGATYWMKKFDFPKFIEYIERYQVTNMFTVPPIYLLIAKSPFVKNQLKSWDDAVGGAAPMGEELQIEASQKLGGGPIRQTWGLSETTGSITIMPLGVKDAPPGCVGSLVASCYARMVDDDGRDVEPGKEGELWVKGPVVTEGYWANDKANKESFKDGWFCTGDIGVFKDGWFWIVDRKKELIKYKGNQVAPAELEALLVSHPKILDAAVIGVAGEGTEVPRAYVVADAKQISGQEIADWVKTQVAKTKFLRGGVVFLPAIPKSPSGKILRRDLREMAKKESQPSKL